MKNFGTTLKERRIALNLTQQEVANHCNVSKSAVCLWEKGRIENMKRDKIQLLADILQMSPIDIVRYTPEPIPRNLDELKYVRDPNTIEAMIR